MLTGFLSRPLRLQIGDKQLCFASVTDFEFALASRTEVPAAKVSELIRLSAEQLREEAARIRQVERHFIDVLARSIEEPGTIGGLLHELDNKLFSQDHQWRELFAALLNNDSRFDDFKRIALVKYVQYLAARQDVLRSIYVGRRQRDAEPVTADEEPGERTPSSSLRETVIFDLSKSPDEYEGEARLQRLPVGEPVLLRLPATGQIELVLSRHHFKVAIGQRLYLVDDGGHDYALHPGSNVVGRQPGNDIVVDAAYRDVSRKHVMIEVGDDSTLLVTDLSSHGTFIRASTAPAV